MMCFYNDGEYPEFFTERTVRPRKVFKCSECFRQIPVGEPTKVTSGKWDGEMQEFRQCQRCVVIIEAVAKVEISEGCHGSESRPSYGGLYEEVEDWNHYREKFHELGLTEALALAPAGRGGDS